VTKKTLYISYFYIRMASKRPTLTAKRLSNLCSTGSFAKLPNLSNLVITGAERQWINNPKLIYHLPSRLVGTSEQLESEGIVLIEGEYYSLDNTREGEYMFDEYQADLKYRKELCGQVETRPLSVRSTTRPPRIPIDFDVELGDIFEVSYLGNVEYFEVVDIKPDFLKVSGKTMKTRAQYNKGKWEIRGIEPEAVVTFLGPPALSREDIRETIIQELNTVENSELHTNVYADYIEVYDPEVGGNLIGFDAPVIMQTKTRAGAVVAFLDYAGQGMRGWNRISVIDFMEEDPKRWPKILETLNQSIKELPVKDIITFPLSVNIKSARKS